MYPISDHALWELCGVMLHEWFLPIPGTGQKPFKRVAFIRSASPFAALATVVRGLAAVFHTLFDCISLPNLMPVEEVVDNLVRFQPDLLVCFPINARQVAIECQARQRRLKQATPLLPNLRQISTAGEPLSAQAILEIRAQLENQQLVFGNLYACTELISIGACRCKHTLQANEQADVALVHAREDMSVLEVVDHTTHQPVTGTCGDVVVTNLTNFAFPLIRYELGDIAAYSVGLCVRECVWCACGCRHACGCVGSEE
jgi:phenylacetate-coenzyme A ligase PaaK-like adenylate-forming protein